jgi:hypothetical protein
MAYLSLAIIALTASEIHQRDLTNRVGRGHVRWAHGLPTAGPHPHRWSPVRLALDGTFEVASNQLLHFWVVTRPRYL